jgi:hypothetical protein
MIVVPGPAQFRAFELPVPEPVFRIDGTPALCPTGSDRAALRFLVRRVAGRPGDLLSHVRRALLGSSLNDGEEAFAALVDLFIATGSRGRAVRQRLTDHCAPLFSPLQRQFLASHLTTGLDATTPVSSDSTVLTGGAGSGKAIRRRLPVDPS